VITRIKSYSFLGFIMIGIVTVLVNLATFQFLMFLGATVYFATFVGNFVSVIVNYSGLTSVFNSSARIKSIFKYSLTWISYYFLTIWLVILFINLNFSALESRVITLILLTPINYIVQKFIVFKV
jgi:putative flippase GtrA